MIRSTEILTSHLGRLTGQFTRKTGHCSSLVSHWDRMAGEMVA